MSITLALIGLAFGTDGLAAESPLAGGTGRRWPRRLLAVLPLAGGVALGTVLVPVDPGWPRALATAMCVVLTVAEACLRR